jgi:hypothetical protein
MKEVGVSRNDLLDGKIPEFKSLANYCKVVYGNFSEMINAYRNSLV